MTEEVRKRSQEESKERSLYKRVKGSSPSSVGIVPERWLSDKSLRERSECQGMKEEKEEQANYRETREVSLPNSVGMVPRKSKLDNSLQGRTVMSLTLGRKKKEKRKKKNTYK